MFSFWQPYFDFIATRPLVRIKKCLRRIVTSRRIRRAPHSVDGNIRTFDIIGIGVMKFNEKGESRRVLYTTETPTIKAGNRFTYFPPVIDFSYQSVLDNLSDAIEAEATNNNAVIVDKIEQTKEELSYRDLLKEAKALWEEIVIVNGEPDEEAARKVLKRVEMIFGRPVKISEITEDQVSLLQLVVLDMRELAEEK